MVNPDQEIKISIIIPCFNEEANLEAGVLTQVATHLETRNFSWEVIIVDDESTDNSYSLCNEFAERNKSFSVFRISHGGKPHALYSGLLRAKGELILFTDMDQSTPIHEMDKLLGWFQKGYQVVIGSRGIQRYGFSIFRKITSWGFRSLRKSILLPDITDTQCGFKMINSQVANEILPKLSHLNSEKEKFGWIVSAYDVELLYLARIYCYKIKEIEVEWSHKDRSVTKGNNQKRYFRESLEMGKEVLNIIWNKVLGRY